MGGSVDHRRTLVDLTHPTISIARQCELVGLARSTLYYEPTGESEENLVLMRLLDEQYTRAPFYGSRRMTAWLNETGHGVNRKRVRRLMQKMGLEAVYPKSRPNKATPEHKVFPYLLRGLAITRPNQVWSTDRNLG